MNKNYMFDRTTSYKYKTKEPTTTKFDTGIKKLKTHS